MLRQTLKDIRKSIPESQQQKGGLLIRARLFTWFSLANKHVQSRGLPALSIAAYWPLRHEPDLLPLISQWDENDINVLLPVMQAKDQPLAFRTWHKDTPMVKAGFGVMEPSTGDTGRPDVVLVPTLGFTKHGDRIGYGQGYYDRTLSELSRTGRKPVAIGIAWSEGNLDILAPTYQPAKHDYKLDAILTPDGWVTGEPDYPFA